MVLFIVFVACPLGLSSLALLRLLHPSVDALVYPPTPTYLLTNVLTHTLAHLRALAFFCLLVSIHPIRGCGLICRHIYSISILSPNHVRYISRTSYCP